MACSFEKGPGGIGMIICGPKTRTRKCSVCGRPSDKLCDFKGPIPGGWKVCDKPLCVACARHEEPDADYCPTHKERWTAPTLLEQPVCDNCDGAPDGGHTGELPCGRALEDLGWEPRPL